MSRWARWLAASVAVTLIGVGVQLGWSSGWLQRFDPTRRTVVFLGDSITAGDGVAPDVTFPQRLGAALGIPVRNAGLSGDTTWRALERLRADVLAHRPKVVVVGLGVNDEVDYHRPAEETLGNLRQIARRLRKDGARVVLVHTAFAEFGAEVYREGLRNIARRERARLVEDFYEGIVPGLTVDGIHPSPEGHALLAARLEPVLRELLGAGPPRLRPMERGSARRAHRRRALARRGGLGYPGGNPALARAAAFFEEDSCHR